MNDHEFRVAVDALRSRESTALQAVVGLRDQASDEDLAYLAMTLAESGDLVRSEQRSGDVASTGGPTSLTTLFAPLWLASVGVRVASLAVPGRPAGGIDAVGSLPGYRVYLDAEQVDDVLASCGYAHFLAGRVFAPLDGELFAYRQGHGAQASAPLAIASLLAKKLAVAVQEVALDVRVAAHGNFGTSRSEARLNANRFKAVANLVGISARCWLTDGSQPYQPWIGRGETLAALYLALTGEGSVACQSHRTR